MRITRKRQGRSTRFHLQRNCITWVCESHFAEGHSRISKMRPGERDDPIMQPRRLMTNDIHRCATIRYEVQQARNILSYIN